MSGNYITVGRGWPAILAAHARAVKLHEPPRCRYHVGVRMKRVETRESCQMTSGNTSFVSLNYRCPIQGCPDVSGVATADDENLVD